jgi:hypothetical protein
VKAALSVVPGSIGMVASSTSTASSVNGTLRDKSAAQIAQQVRATLQKLKVPASTASLLVANKVYTPSDLLIIATALTRLKAANSSLFVARAAQATTRDVALFQRRRAELLAEKSAELGGVVEFASIGGFPLNRTRDGSIVALFPLDDIAWTAIGSRAITAMTDELRASGYNGQPPVLATTAVVTPLAREEITKLGWTIVALK